MPFVVLWNHFVQFLLSLSLVKIALDLLKKYKNFVIYSVIGASGAGLDYLIFLLLVLPLGVDKFLANGISVSAGIINNFLLNVFFNFRTRDRLFRRFAMFFGVGMLGLILSWVLLWLGIDVLGMNVPLVKLGSIFLVVLLQYNLNKIFAFARNVI